MSESESLDDLIDSTGSSLFDWVLKISLFIGAIFQLVCIFAVILLPGRTSENGDAETEEVIVKHEGTLSESAKPPSLTPDQPSRSTASRANKRHEKKKKR